MVINTIPCWLFNSGQSNPLFIHNHLYKPDNIIPKTKLKKL